MKFGRENLDLIDIVEAAYDVEKNDGDWLAGVIEAVRPAAHEDLGMFGYLYDTAERPFRVHHLFHDTPVSDAGVELLKADTNDDYVRRSWRAPSIALASETEGFSEYPPVMEAFHPVGIRDVFTINALDDIGVGCWIGAPLPKLARLEGPMRERWGRVAAHIRAALRLRMRLANKRRDEDSGSAKTEAVLRPGGKVEHLEGAAVSARAALRDAVVAMQRAREELRAEPDRALPAWRALVKARWSLIDDFQSGGDHYIIARANSVASSGLGLLSSREAQVVACLANGLTNKETAYELGISDSTVRVLVVRACQKLRVSGREQLIAAYRAEALKSG